MSERPSPEAAAGARRLPDDLATYPIFRGIPGPGMEVLRRCLSVVQLNAGQRLFDHGDDATSAFVVLSGRLALDLPLQGGAGRFLQVARLGPGTSVGELALVEAGPRSLRAHAVETTSLLRIDVEAFTRLKALRHPAAYQLLRNVCATTCGRLRHVNSFIESELRGERGKAMASEVAREDEATRARGFLSRLFGGR
ncbi:MAG: cyclic nucleotide-binding domain-containing protein [Myxococcales bacterium]|nr:cyclic nucleotide-binding domain-containing protein [Myxococcales bacterium]MCB9549921.1 cyclic nucleotide-binding domain-containing protein [Myxococcales bacterium]